MRARWQLGAFHDVKPYFGAGDRSGLMMGQGHHEMGMMGHEASGMMRNGMGTMRRGPDDDNFDDE